MAKGTILLWTSLAWLGVTVATPIPLTSVEPFVSDASTSFDGDKYVCLLDDIMYRAGDSVAASTPCESCFCQPPRVVCAYKPVKCDKKPGCKALLRTNQCCPEYQCECERDGKTYNNGEKLESLNNPCEVCYCRGGEVVCTFITCYKRDDCQPQEVPGRCCPKYDHCPPLDSSNMKMTTTTWPITNASASSASSPPPSESAIDNTLTTILTAVTTSRQHTLPGEYRVTGQASRRPYTEGVERHESTTPSTDNSAETKSEVASLAFTYTGNYETTSQQEVIHSRVPDDANAEDSVAESSEHYPVHVLPEYDTRGLGNETDVLKDHENSTLNNSIDYEDSTVQATENMSVSEINGVVDTTANTSENEHNKRVQVDASDLSVDVRSMEVTTEVPTTETNSVLATPSVFLMSSRAPLTSELWEEHRPTQMVTDDIQYVTTFDPLMSIPESKSSEASTLGSKVEDAEEVTNNGSYSSDVSIERSATESEKEADATIESVNSATEGDLGNSNEESTTVIYNLVKVNNLIETEGSESTTESTTEEPSEIITSMETLFEDITSSTDNDENVKEVSLLQPTTLNTPDSDADDLTTDIPAVILTIIPDNIVPQSGDDVDEEDEDPSLPVLKLSEEMANHQMDFVIHHIVVPTESDDSEEDSQLQDITTPEEHKSQTTELLDSLSNTTVSVGEEEHTTESNLVNYTGSEEHAETSSLMEEELKSVANNVTSHEITSATPIRDIDNSDPMTTSQPTEMSDQQGRVVSACNDDETTMSTPAGETESERSIITTELNNQESTTDIASHDGRSNLTDLSVETHKETSNVTMQKLDSLKGEEGFVTIAEETTTQFATDTSSTMETERTQSITTYHLDNDVTANITQVTGDESDTEITTTSSSQLIFILQETSSSDFRSDEIVTTSGPIDEETNAPNATWTPDEILGGENITDTFTAEDISNSTSSNVETTELEAIIQENEQFQSNKSSLSNTDIVDDAVNVTESRFQEDDIQNTTLILITEDPITNIVTSFDISPSPSQDDTGRLEVKRETVMLTNLSKSHEKNSALVQNTNSEHIFTELQREDAEEIGKYDLTLLQNFFKNLYIHNDHAEVDVT